ncbi:MAG: tRNA lysidine(34) synthetase TilS [Treponema sp.]|nr:tRNA lysidine(34) synthetase TilS [Treponema sp.]
MEDIARNFESKLLSGLHECGADFSPCLAYGVGVSGGADSISLLTSLSRTIPSKNLVAVTVNHNIRPAEQTEGDASFVEDYCKRIGVRCFRVDIPRGEVERIKKERGSGTEEAARYLRYQAFESAISKFGLDWFCLAHNLNDQEETLLMRFFSGGASQSLCGIPQVRGRFIRPLLNVSRSEIEAYLAFLGLEFRTDSTNKENSMLRNKIRNRIIPFLDTELPGWQKAVLSLGRKMSLDESFISNSARDSIEKIDWKEGGGQLSFSEDKFKSLPKALQSRVIYSALDKVLKDEGTRVRIPYTFIEGIQRNLQILPKIKSDWAENSSGAEVLCSKGRIFVRKVQKVATESGFFAIITKEGIVRAGNWTLGVSKRAGMMHMELEHALSQNGSAPFSVDVEGLEFPFAFRSRQSGDSIKTASGSLKSISGILDGWKCGSFRSEIPVVQDLTSPLQPLVCILGAPLGFNNWIVQKEER